MLGFISNLKIEIGYGATPLGPFRSFCPFYHIVLHGRGGFSFFLRP